ncbi:16S rRNA (guanine(527)-N(7))-methyltransferase RsmG, partial [Pantoea allii]
TDMVNWCHHLPAREGRFFALKGVRPDDEIAELPAGYVSEAVIKLQVPQLEGDRHLVIIRHQ